MDDDEARDAPTTGRSPALDPSGGDGDLAAQVLADTRGFSAGRFRRRDREAARRTRRDNLAGRSDGRNHGGYSGPGPDPARDPQRLGELVGTFVDGQGWERPLAQARVFTEWPALVGAELAQHCRPQALVERELRVVAESTAWATQLRLLSSALLARLVAELGTDVVARIVISGPTAPTWKHGRWSVRGGRGPRDTYG